MHTQYPLVELPKSTDLTLLLIREELKSRRIFRHLAKAGLDYTPFQPNLDEAILQATGLSTDSDQVFAWYTRLMEKHSKKLTHDARNAGAQALKVFVKLAARQQPEKNTALNAG